MNRNYLEQVPLWTTLDGVVTTIGIAGAIIAILAPPTPSALWIAIPLAVVLAAIKIRLAYLNREQKYHRFKSEKEHRFFNFFQDWYSRSGNHYVFCTDLDWLDNPSGAAVIAALSSHGDKTHVYLRDLTASCVEKLRQDNCDVREMPSNFADPSVKLSINFGDKGDRVILREKNSTPGDDTVHFLETAQPQIIAIVKALTASFPQESAHQK